MDGERIGACSRHEILLQAVLFENARDARQRMEILEPTKLSENMTMSLLLTEAGK